MTATPQPPAVPPPRRRFRRCRRLLVFSLILVTLYLARGWLLPPVGRFLDVSETPRSCDCVMVLGGGANERPFVAAALVRSNRARRVLVPTVKLSPENQDGIYPPEHELIRRVLLSRGVPSENVVLLPGACASTRDEAGALAAFLETEPDATVAVVTHDFHTRRARLLFRRVLGDRLSGVHFVSAPTEGFDADSWWRSEEGFVTYMNEYVKLTLYSLWRAGA